MPASRSLRPQSVSIRKFQSAAPISVPAGHRLRASTNSHDNATPFVRGATPLATGSSIRQKLEPDSGYGGKYKSEDYRDFILEDFDHQRVFVGMCQGHSTLLLST